MKLLLIILITFSFGEELQNPNGKPFTLNINTKWGFDTAAPNVNISLPLSTYLSLHGGLCPRYEIVDYGNIESLNVSSQGYLGFDLQLPLYKLWE